MKVVQAENFFPVSKTGEIDWETYASNYDLLASSNPSYLENIELLRDAVRDMELPEDPVICDVGAGTGNFICAIGQDLPQARFVHLDFDATMNEIALHKYRALGLERVDVHCCPADEAGYPAETFDLIISVNALYAMQPQREVLRRIRSWLKPSGTFFVIDYGRQVQLLDWAVYMVRSSIRTRGFWATAKLFKKNLGGARQNRRGARGQADGRYWLHSTEEFGEILEDAGFAVRDLRPCYRGYSDLAICQPKQST